MTNEPPKRVRSKTVNVKPPLSAKGKQALENRLLKAVLTSNPKEVIACIQAGVDPNAYVGGGTAAIHIAAERGDIATGIALATYPDLNINARSTHGYTPLILACMIRKRKFVKFLLKNGADANIIDHHSMTALHHSCRIGAMELVFDLVKYGANVNATDSFENTPLSISLIDKNLIPMAKYLVKKGADVDPKDRYTPILIEYAFACSEEEHIDGIHYLLECGVDINLQAPVSKKTALHAAAQTGYVPLARYLLERGADFTIEDARSMTPKDIALEHENYYVLDLLEDYSQRYAFRSRIRMRRSTFLRFE